MKRKPTGCRLVRTQLSEKEIAELGHEFPSYIGQSINVAARWETYVKSAIYPSKKFKNSLDKLPKKGGYWICLRLIDWGIHADSLDDLERCRIAQLRPSLNRITYGFDLSYCDRPIKNTRVATRLSGIYQIVCVPRTMLILDPTQAATVTDVVRHFQYNLPHHCNRETLFVPTDKLGFHLI